MACRGSSWQSRRVPVPIGFSFPAWAHPKTALGATLWFVLGTLLSTWPLATGLARDIPWDLGDSLLNCWILAWNAQHFLRVLHGDWSALTSLWHGNIFHPAPYTLGYSELLLAQSVQILPIYAWSGNIILCYNVLFLSSFVMSGLGMYLLVREITTDWRAGFVAGALYAFALYRIGQGPHLQSLSSQWLPFVFWTLRRYFTTRRWSWVFWSAGALTAHNLSNGYYLLFGALFVPIYVIYELVDRRAWREARHWVAMGAVAALSGLVTLPSLMPYLALRSLGEPPRPLAEVIAYSADVASYVTASPNARAWGSRIELYLQPEGELFPGVTLLLLAALAGFSRLRDVWRALAIAEAWSGWTRGLMAIAVLAGVRAAIVFTGVRQLHLGPILVRVRGDVWLFGGVAACALILAAVTSPRVRQALRGTPGALPVVALCLAALAAWLSLGPVVRIMGASMPNLAIYDWLYAYVPGYDGLRVPARLAMFVTFFLTVAAGHGAHGWLSRSSTPTVLLVVLSGAAWAEGLTAPLPMNTSSAGPFFKAPPARISPTSTPPVLYRFLRELPDSTVLVEFPFGDSAWESRHVYHAAVHGKRLVNGYSGGFPSSYSRVVGTLSRVPERDDAWPVLRELGVTHAVVHDLAFEGDRGRRLRAWLVEHGATLVGDYGSSGVYQLPRP